MSASARWEYGGAYMRLNMTGEIPLPNDSRVMVCDWTRQMPAFMRDADTLFIDPPWNQGNRKSFYTKAGLAAGPETFIEFARLLFDRIDNIKPAFLFLEIGKENLHEFLAAAKQRYRYVTFYNSIYYKKQSNKCYVIHASDDAGRKRYSELEDMPQSDIVRWLCRHHEFTCIGDLCMGRGLVGRSAYEAGKRFVGTELNPKRLAVLVDWIQLREKEKHNA